MKINRNNYEVFFIDYFDGKLSADQVAELMSFLLENNDLAEEFNCFENITLDATEVEFVEKKSLKKSQNDNQISISKFDETCIAYIEKDLSISETTEFEKNLFNNPSKFEEYRIFTKTILKPYLAITYENKSGLKHFEIKKYFRKIFITGLSAAASIAILFLMYYLISSNKTIAPKYAERKNTIFYESIDSSDNEKVNQSSHKKEKLKDTDLKENQNIYQQFEKQNNLPEKQNLANNTLLFANDAKEKVTQDSIIQTVKAEIPEHLNNKKLVALDFTVPIHENIYIDWSNYKIKDLEFAVHQNIRQKVTSRIQKAVMGESHDPNHKFGIVDVADLIVKGISKMTDREMKLHKTYDTKGNVETLAFYSENLQIYKGGKNSK